VGSVTAKKNIERLAAMRKKAVGASDAVEPMLERYKDKTACPGLLGYIGLD
jgi:hypothetical protein